MLEKFHFTPTDGEEIVVPYMQDVLRRKDIRAINNKHKGDEDELMDAMLKKALDKETFNRLEDLTLRDYRRFITDWSERGDVTLGESEQ